MKDRKGVDPDGRVGTKEYGGVKRRKTVIRIYCEKKIYFQKKKKIKKERLTVSQEHPCLTLGLHTHTHIHGKGVHLSMRA